MNITAVTDTFSVSPQILLSDLEILARQGFSTIICNRPDDEAGAVPSAAMRDSAGRLGLAFHHIPITPGIMTETQVDEMVAALGAATGNVLAFCRSGNRSMMLFQAAQSRVLAQSA